MIFLGEDYWTNVKPVYPLLRHLATDREYGAALHITDDIAEVLDAVRA